MRLISAAVLITAALAAVWAPLLVSGSGWPAVILAVVVGVQFLGVASNHAVLLWLSRGRAPLRHQPARTGAVARLLMVCLIPGALPVLARRTAPNISPETPTSLLPHVGISAGLSTL